MTHQHSIKAWISSEVYIAGQFQPGCVLAADGIIVGIESHLPDGFAGEVIDCGQAALLPGIVDTHVHINEPGRTDWEGFASATQAAAAGGITTLVDMPLNCIPATVSADALHEKLAAVRSQLWVDCGFWGGVTPENLEQLPALLAAGVLGVKSFLIESGVPEFRHVTFEQAARAMPLLRDAGLPYLFHAEWDGGVASASSLGSSYVAFVESRPKIWEDAAIERLITLCRAHRCRTHIVHLSSASALPVIRTAKDEGLPLTVETCPHYLCFDAESIERQPSSVRPLYKCCPPIRERANADALWQGLADGTIDFVVSDHSPCTLNLKHLEDGDLHAAWGGIMGLQMSLLAVMTEAQERGLTWEAILPKFTEAPSAFVGLSGQKGRLAVGCDADIVVVDRCRTTELTDRDLHHKNKRSPYVGRSYNGQIVATYLRGQLVFANGKCGAQALGRPLGVGA